MRTPSFCGLVLAAGESSRMGHDKALLPWRGKSFLSATIDVLQPFTDMVIVVAGKNSQQLAPIVYTQAGFLVVNPEPERGQFSSLQEGLREVLNRGRDAAIVALVDRPPVALGTLEQLRLAFSVAYNRDKWAVIPQYEGKHGHPILVGREMMEVFLKAAPDRTAREIEHEHQERIEYVAVKDPHVTLNVDTPEDYHRLTGETLAARPVAE